MDVHWVPVMRLQSPAVPEATEALRRAGIPARVEQGSPHLGEMVPDSRYLDPDTIFVPESEIEQARGVLAAYLEVGESRVQGHMRALRGELAVGAAAISAGVLIVQWIIAGFATAWPWGIVLLVCAPFAWRRLREKRPA